MNLLRRRLTTVQSTPSFYWRGTLGFLSVCVLPAWILGESLRSARGGWRPHSLAAGFVVAAATLGLLASIGALLTPRFRRRLAENWPRLSLACVSTILAAGLADAMGPWLTLVDDPHLRSLPHALTFHPDPDLFPGVASPARYSLNEQGIRGRPWPSRSAARRILCLGGSTTECLYLDDDQTWPSQLDRQLNGERPGRYWVGGAGMTGARVVEHLAFVQSSRLTSQVDAVVVLAGADDFLRAVLRVEAPADGPSPLWARTWLARQLGVGGGGTNLGFPLDDEGKAYREFQMRIPVRAAPDLAGALDRFTEDARSLAFELTRLGVELIAVTQPVLWDDAMPPLSLRMLRYGRGDAVPEAPKISPAAALAVMERFQRRLVDVCGELGVPLVDAAPRMTGRREYFHDEIHLNDAGCREIARLIADVVLRGDAEAGREDAWARSTPDVAKGGM